MAKLMTLLTALILAMIALFSLYHVIQLTPIETNCCHITLFSAFLLYIGTGTFTAYLLRVGRKL